ncbi:M91 family zinc metallopeptidase [Candidatus Williamhamiltonella defendens]|uniref:M91 family zinc metallopeptidase n=1 Tax=Candidatus Williamhamiltonella defendens TaxID=138072 RepID=UPI001581DC0A|nr:M91 family zinc metallopeptidase [Candidatus Hamiltonella defensa]
MRRALKLNLTPLSFSSSSNSDTDIQSLVKKSSVNWIKNNHQLSFDGTNKNIYQRLEKALDKIESTETGKELLNCIESVSRLKSEKLIIRLDSTELGVTAHCAENAENFRGTGSYLHCNLNSVQEESIGKGIEQTELDACIVFHELLHVFHNLNGERLKVAVFQPEVETYSPFLLEEARTVGLGSFSEEVFSENKFREEIGIPRRVSYAHESSLIHDDNTFTMFFENKQLHPLLRELTSRDVHNRTAISGTSAQQNSSSDTQNTIPGAGSEAETANNTTQNTAAISNATAHAALALTSSERGYDNPFKPLADNEPSQRVSIEEKSQKEKAENAIKHREDTDNQKRLTKSTTLKQRIEPQKIITSAGTELSAESLEPHQPVARFDVSDAALLEPWLMRLKNKNAVQRLEEYFKITQEILDTCGLEDSKRLFAHPNLVKEAVCFAGHSLNGGMFKDAYLSPLKITYLSAASLAQEGKLPNEYYSVWTHDKETFSPTRLLLNIYGKDYDSPPKISGKNDSESSPKRLQPLFSILKSAQSPSFKRLGADLNHFLKDLKKEKSLNKDHIKNIMESFAAFSVQHSAPPGFLAANGKDEMTTVNSLDALKKSVKNVIENFEALKREDETLGEALEAQRTSEAVNNAQTQQKQAARQIASDRSLSAFFQENQRKAVEFKQNKEREDRETQYKKTVESQQSEIKKSILSRKLESDMFAYNLHNENKLALEQQASKKRAEEAKKLNDAGKKPALEGPNLSGARSASENNGALNGSGKNQSASALNEPSTSQGHLESVAENDSALNKELLIQTISSLPGAEQIERRDGDNIILDLKVDLHISNQTKIFNQKNDKDGTARLEVTVKPEKTKTVYSAHNTTSIEPENSATGPQLATLYSLNKSDAGIGIHIKGADGSEMKTAWPWKAFDNFNYTSPQKNILITTGAIPNGDQPQALPNSFSEASVKGNISFNSENDIEKSRIEKKQPQWPEAQKNLAQLYQESERHREKAKQEKRWADAENQREKNEESRVSHERRDFLHKAAESRMVKNNLRETELKKSSNKNGVL